MKHKHHIIPRHMGGTDEPENIIELTPEEHAQAHLDLYEKYGKWQDKYAWEMLSGQARSEEVSKKIWETRRMNGKDEPWNKGVTLKDDPNNKGLLKARETNLRAREEGKLSVIGDHMRGKEFSDEHKQKLREKKLNAPKKKCPHCGKEAAAGMYARWHGDNCKDIGR